jgi:hypothetical protein
MSSKSGLARAAALSPERRSEIARKAALARWAKPRVTYRVTWLTEGLRVLWSKGGLSRRQAIAKKDQPMKEGLSVLAVTMVPEDAGVPKVVSKAEIRRQAVETLAEGEKV